jgi:DNA sulfur modification protein DndB
MTTKSSKTTTKTIETVGLMIKQSAGETPLFVFSVDAKTICQQVGVRRMTWQGGQYPPQGFQRPLDSKRVVQIAIYLNNNRILPNALVVAFEKGCLTFDAIPGLDKDPIQVGKITIHGKLMQANGETQPFPEDQRIGYVIDGQHRMKAIETSVIEEGTFPIVISAYCGVDAKFQLSQFYVLNQTVQISPSLLALLRTMLKITPAPKEARKQAISSVRELLQNKPGSPFEPGVYMKVSKILKHGNLDVTVVERMIDRAIQRTSLKHKWNPDPSQIPDADFEYIAQSLFVFWKAVQETFPNYWGKKPREQRLFSAIGLYTLVEFFDQVMTGIDVVSVSAVPTVKNRIKPFADLHWDQMLDLPSVPKGVYPEALFTALNQLFQHGTARPYRFRVVDPVTKFAFVDQDLP